MYGKVGRFFKKLRHRQVSRIIIAKSHLSHLEFRTFSLQLMRTRDFLESRKRRELRVQSALTYIWNARERRKSARMSPATVKSILLSVHALLNLRAMLSCLRGSKIDTIRFFKVNRRCLCPRRDSIGTKARKRQFRWTYLAQGSHISSIPAVC